MKVLNNYTLRLFTKQKLTLKIINERLTVCRVHKRQSENETGVLLLLCYFNIQFQRIYHYFMTVVRRQY